MTQEYAVGIDEAGRGPIAGPVAVGGCMMPNLVAGGPAPAIARVLPSNLEAELLEKFMRGKLKDSKKLSEKKREEIFTWMQEKKECGELDFVVSMGSAKTIDKQGIVPTIRKALAIVLTKLMKSQQATLGGPTAKCCEGEVQVLLDGGLRAPDAFKHQETIIKGDENEVVISLASIAAKVTRDRYMRGLAERCKEEGSDYGFERHKGYGTKAHYEAIGEYGLCIEHRRSFCKSVRK